ncbi:unnamed protein product (macronuclear) [Paramecium tetraurelia]|uniref:Uncharacterized protein n=1 Tax=Paramecium tetraurelia TaxID=5888 RepID=A0CIC1_PARTE|nr:uncharacterized protein GSPATT00007673001 [Paramecium tetraurelia]CAK70538.1 unnamed protein product [Paramecium tetraurelia]|eukprot:XP_001437935.1 hypothetical protein (macronuclear) [Paramecium tetraurelia strain d4-2]
MNANYPIYLQEIKENCAPLKDIQLSHKKSLPHIIESITQKIPQVKKQSIHKICSQQEQRIYSNIHKLKKYNLLKEIGHVNPQLHQELQNTRDHQLPYKLIQYQKIKQQQGELITENQESTNNLNDCYGQDDIMCSNRKILLKPCMRNIMDDYENRYNEYSDSYINKYLDLN